MARLARRDPVPLPAAGSSPPSVAQSGFRLRHNATFASQGCEAAALSTSRFAPASRRKCAAAAAGHGSQGPRASQYQFDDDEPLWLAVVRDLAASLRNLVGFLAEQPMQLKHLEWPGFGTRTATLTLVLVAVFIVVLSSVDAALSYILSWLLRKSA